MNNVSVVYRKKKFNTRKTYFSKSIKNFETNFDKQSVPGCNLRRSREGGK